MSFPLPSEQLFQARLKANDFVVEFLKQLITLASGTLVLTITFIKDILGPHASDAVWGWLVPLAWISFALCIVMSVWSIGRATKNLDTPDMAVGASGQLKAFMGGSQVVALHSLVAIGAFCLGMASLAAFAGLNFGVILSKPAQATVRLIDAASAVEVVKAHVPVDTIVVSIDQVALRVQPPNAPGSYLAWDIQVVSRQRTLAGDGVGTATLYREHVFVDAQSGDIESPPRWRH